MTGSERTPGFGASHILGGPSDNKYQSKRQQKRLLRATIVKARINAIHEEGRHEETKLIDVPISFPHVNLNRVIMPHYDLLVFTLYINSFDVHMVPIDPSSATDLVQLPTFKHMNLSLGVVNSTERVLSGDFENMQEDKEVPIFLGRQFLAMGRAMIDLQKGELRLRVQEEEVTFNVFNAIKHPMIPTVASEWIY